MRERERERERKRMFLRIQWSGVVQKKIVCLDFHKKGTLIINFHVSPFSQSATQCNENWIEFDLQIKCFDSLERILVLNQVSTKTNWDFIKSPPYFAASEMNISTWKGPVCFDLLFRVCNKHITNTQCKKIITISTFF